MPKIVDFDNLKPYEKRQFVPQSIDLTSKDNVVELYQKLLNIEISSVQELESWILQRSELEAALDQAGSILYIKMTCQTDDKARAEAYTKFIEEVAPAVEPLEDALNKKFLEAHKQYSLDEERYAIYTREIKEDVDLFREENVELSTKVSLLSQEYQTISGAMTVEFEGKEQTMPQMGKYQLEPDRDLRERAWRATAERRLKDVQRLDDIFDKMLKLRHQIAVNTDEKNFCDYKFRSLHRFDYTPEDCKTYHDTVELILVPLWHQILLKRKKEMKLDDLRPWDLAVDPLGRPALKPFEEVEQLVENCKQIFNKVDGELGKQFTGMADEGLLDLASRAGKAPGGYQSALDESRKPFIFMNAVGVDSDVRTLLHEAGHAFHSMACVNEPLVDYRHGPMEFNEVASMAMELLGDEHLGYFYKGDDLVRSRLEHFEGVIFTLIWVATIDAFQHWIYENPTHTAEERKTAWLEIYDRFNGGCVNWEGLEETKAFMWHRQLHIFEVPFYYIEYAIAQLGALQVWQNAKQDLPNAVSQYKKALALGGSKPLPQLYETAGIRFDFTAETIGPLIDAVKEEFEKI